MTGRVRLADGAELPRYRQEDMERKVLTQAPREALPEACPPPKVADREAVKLTPEGFLQGVLVAASDFKDAKPRPPRVHDVRIEDCRLTPRLVAGVKGDTVRLTNAVDYPFMPSLAGDEIVRTLMPHQKFEFTMDRGTVDAIRCGFTAPCGRTDVFTMFHPVFGVTDAEGRFRIEDFPTDQDVKLHAWHPLFEEVELSVRVEQGQTKSVDFVLKPNETYLEASAERDAALPDEPTTAE